MRRTDQPSLPHWIQNAYESLETAYASDTDELSREAVHEHLLTEAEQIETDADATYVLDRLLERGWLYEVNGHLRKTD
jgi:predicted DCC family thiol-disulfide oxidoreductase YuxK